MRLRDRLKQANEDGAHDAQRGIAPNPAYITNGFGGQWRHYQAWRYAYDAGYYSQLAHIRRKQLNELKADES